MDKYYVSTTDIFIFVYDSCKSRPTGGGWYQHKLKIVFFISQFHFFISLPPTLEGRASQRRGPCQRPAQCKVTKIFSCTPWNLLIIVIIVGIVMRKNFRFVNANPPCFLALMYSLYISLPCRCVYGGMGFNNLNC